MGGGVALKIVNRQISGLGNQMFQYAAGRYYGMHLQAPVTMAVDPPDRAHSYGSPRPFLLSHFRITTPFRVLTTADRLLLSTKPRLAPVLKAARQALGIQVFAEPMEQRFRFVPDFRVAAATRTLYLAGYWQSCELVNAVEAVLRRELAFQQEPEGLNRAVLAQMAQCAAPVSLHVRRGDYALESEGKRVLSMEYYARAIAHIRERVADPTFFVFSDDIPFTRENLPGGIRAVFVDHNDDASSHEDMRLMSACHHHIVANSSFSWWGAWLNPRPDKVVVAPRHWLLTPDSYYPGLLPSEWLLVDSDRTQAG